MLSKMLLLLYTFPVGSVKYRNMPKMIKFNSCRVKCNTSLTGFHKNKPDTYIII